MKKAILLEKKDLDRYLSTCSIVVLSHYGLLYGILAVFSYLQHYRTAAVIFAFGTGVAMLQLGFLYLRSRSSNRVLSVMEAMRVYGFSTLMCMVASLLCLIEKKWILETSQNYEPLILLSSCLLPVLVFIKFSDKKHAYEWI